LTEQQCQDYAARRLAAADLLPLDDHLAACAECGEKLSVVLQARTGGALAVNSTPWELTAIGEDFHLSFAQMSDWVDNRLDEVDREIITSHLEFCRSCQAEIEDLHAFRQSLAAPAPAPPDPPPIVVAGWRERLKNVRQARWLLLPAAAALALAGIGYYFWPRQQEPVAKQQPAAPPIEKSIPAAAVSPAPPSPPPDPSPRPATPEEQAVQMALATGRIEIPAEAKELVTPGSTLLSDARKDTSFALLSPQGVIIESTRPRLRWTSLPEAKHYVVTITDQDFNPVAQSPPLTVREWSPPNELTRNRVYRWEVTATTRDGNEVTVPPPAAPEAKFRVLANESLRSLRHARQQYAGSPLELGIIYARVGLLDEAERAFTRAEKTSPLARRFRESLQQQRK
jgi:hypothetical protein